jgi:hypothetical protein
MAHGELIDAITSYLDRRNENPMPFVWAASVPGILKKVLRGSATLASLH